MSVPQSTDQKLDPNRQWEADLEDRMSKKALPADPVSLLREVRKSLASMPGCDCESCSLVTRIDEALRRADDVSAPHDPKCKPDFPFHLCQRCYPGL